MKIKKEYRNTYIFFAFLILAGFFHFFQRYLPLQLDTLLSYVIYLIYTGLVIYWMLSVRRRLLPTRIRTYMTAAALLLVLFFVIRLFKYRVVEDLALCERYSWYAFYIPEIFTPTLFAMCGIRVGREEHASWHFPEWALLIPAAFFAGLVLTNDLHQLVFRALVPLAELNGRNWTYSYRPMFYIIYLWIIAMIVLGIFSLFRKSDIKGAGGRWIAPSFFVILWGVMVAGHFAMQRFTHTPYQIPEIFSFCMIGILESSIRNRLLPYNDNYPVFFENLKVPILITDRDFHPVYHTASPLGADKGQLKSAIISAVYPEEGIRLSGKSIHGGYAYWLEDENVYRQLNAELEEANETLSMENEIIDRERSIDREKEALEKRIQIFAEAAKAVYPAQKKTGELLEKIVPGDPGFRGQIAEVLVQTAYIKRKSNFTMLRTERGTITGEELAAALEESAHYLSYTGTEVTIDNRSAKEYDSDIAIGLYDTFEMIAEAFCGKTPALWIRLSEKELLFMADAEEVPGIGGTPLPLHVKSEDGQVILRAAIGGEGV